MAVLESTRGSACGGANNEARRQSEVLFSVLRPSRLYDRPILEREHRVILYIGHLDSSSITFRFAVRDLVSIQMSRPSMHCFKPA